MCHHNSIIILMKSLKARKLSTRGKHELAISSNDFFGTLAHDNDLSFLLRQ